MAEKNVKPKVLIVDDEKNNLISFKSAFRRHYTIFTAENVDEAMDILEAEEIHVLLSDQRMPKMTGVEFLELVVAKYPSTMRMLLTGFDDFEPAIEALNRGAIYKYISKPWDEHELKNNIDNAYETYCNRLLLETKNAELKKAYEELDNFVYRASHDIRGPLMSVLGLTGLARLEGSIDSVHEYLDLIDKSVHQLDLFMRNMVDYSRNSRLEERIDLIDLKKFMNEVQASVMFTESESKEVEIQTAFEGDTSFSTDKERLKIVIQNLISNAIRFRSKERKSFVKLSFYNNVDSLKIEVQDNGVGIKEDQFDHVFNMFYRGSEISNGSGIGLYVCRETASRLKGTITLSSEVGIGTTFTILIPFREEE